MITRDTDLFEYEDKVVKILLRKLLRKFRSLNRKIQANTINGLDELNVITSVNKMYDEVIELTLEFLKAVALRAYWKARRKKRDDDFLLDLWLMGYLAEYNPVTEYLFFQEADRKRARLIEAIMSVLVTPNQKTTVQKVIDQALRYWVRQVEQFGDCVVLAATEKAYEDNGTKKLMWVTQKDDRVCSLCRPLDGRIFQVGEVPPPQHYNCRCFTVEL
jgi:SPP1 gp7 family putative phage head morphogenesis protein